MKDDKIMTIREMCEMFNVTPRTLRFYESKELLSPSREGQKRLYSYRERARLKLIQRGKRFGFDLEKIRQIINLYDLNDASHSQFVYSLKVGKERLVQLTEQRNELNLVLKELAELIDWVEGEIPSKAAEKTNAAEPTPNLGEPQHA